MWARRYRPVAGTGGRDDQGEQWYWDPWALLTLADGTLWAPVGGCRIVGVAATWAAEPVGVLMFRPMHKVVCVLDAGAVHAASGFVPVDVWVPGGQHLAMVAAVPIGAGSARGTLRFEEGS